MSPPVFLAIRSFVSEGHSGALAYLVPFKLGKNRQDAEEHHLGGSQAGELGTKVSAAACGSGIDQRRLGGVFSRALRLRSESEVSRRDRRTSHAPSPFRADGAPLGFCESHIPRKNEGTSGWRYLHELRLNGIHLERPTDPERLRRNATRTASGNFSAPRGKSRPLPLLQI